MPDGRAIAKTVASRAIGAPTIQAIGFVTVRATPCDVARILHGLPLQFRDS